MTWGFRAEWRRRAVHPWVRTAAVVAMVLFVYGFGYQFTATYHERLYPGATPGTPDAGHFAGAFWPVALPGLAGIHLARTVSP